MSNTKRLFFVATMLLVFAPARAIGSEKAGSSLADPCRIVVLNNLVSELMDAGQRGLLVLGNRLRQPAPRLVFFRLGGRRGRNARQGRPAVDRGQRITNRGGHAISAGRPTPAEANRPGGKVGGTSDSCVGF